MKATKLKQKYPEVWDSIYFAMTETMINIMPQVDVELFYKGYDKGRIGIIANNAAFLGCYELHKSKKNLVSIKKV